jgi:ApaG protein
MPGSQAVTRGIRVQVESRHHPERSRPAEDEWFFSYTIKIRNEGTGTVQLLTRHWVITDGNGHIEEIRGPGVVGQQPVLAAGQSFEYTSFCPLKTSFGTMHGTYQMVTDGGEAFDAEIAPFPLGEPHSIN